MLFRLILDLILKQPKFPILPFERGSFPLCSSTILRSAEKIGAIFTNSLIWCYIMAVNFLPKEAIHVPA